jgi:lipoate-protein ligase A
MAIDEFFFYSKEADSNPILRFYMWNPTSATIGRNQSLLEEIDVDYADYNGIQYTRRITGGGAVLHSSVGELTYMFVSPKAILEETYNRLIKDGIFNADDIPKYYVPILQSIISGLSELGLRLDVNKMHCPAIMIDDKKISGNAQAMRSDVILQHGTVLLSVDAEQMYSVLKVPSYTTKKNIVLSVKAKVGSLNDYVDSSSISIDNLCKCLTKGFSKVFSMDYDVIPLSETELIAIEKLAEKYKSKDWIFKK